MKQYMTADVPLEEKVAFLRQAASYPYKGCDVTVKETHMSWVFLVNGFVYKLKKPVTNRLFDFTHVEARLKNCLNEVELNRRLAKDIYIGVVPLVMGDNGLLTLVGKGETVDWLVKMKRLPEEQMLGWQITKGTVNVTQVKRTASMLSDFYRQSPAIKIDPASYLHKIQKEIESTCNELMDPAYDLPTELIANIKTALFKFLKRYPGLFGKRVVDGKIIEAHGDLRPEHVFMGEPPAIIDCLEFNRDLRTADVVEELSYLAMECEALGNNEVGKIFLETWLSSASDDAPHSLILFFKLKKALLRIYLVIRHITEPQYKYDPKWKISAGNYLRLANVYFREL